MYFVFLITKIYINAQLNNYMLRLYVPYTLNFSNITHILNNLVSTPSLFTI